MALEATRELPFWVSRDILVDALLDAGAPRCSARRAIKILAAFYLQRYDPVVPGNLVSLSDSLLVSFMESDCPQLRGSAYFHEWIYAMLCYQRNARASLGRMIYT